LIAQIIVELSGRAGLPPHLLLGNDALAHLERADERRRQSVAEWRHVSASVDFR